MILITSAAYITPGLISEFGKLPPCMLPVQNRRLYFHQIKLLSPLKEDIFISLPKDYKPSTHDLNQLSNLGAKLIYVPVSLSLGASVVYSLNMIARFGEPVRILHGDTLIGKIPLELMDACAVAEAEDNYNWESVDKEESSDLVFSGYFSFSSQSDLVRNITENDFQFMEGVKAYCRKHNSKLFKVNSWLDFGIVNSYYRSKSKMTTERVFNDLKIDRFSVTKYSKDSHKILAESHWLRSIPCDMKHYVPSVWREGINGDRGFYQIEYFYLSSLADIFVFGNNSSYVWKDIVKSCLQFLNDASKHIPDNTADLAVQSVKLYGEKTRKRINVYARNTGLDLNQEWRINGHQTPSLNAIIEDISKEVDQPRKEFIGIMHGDFCFSNILYDFKSQSIKVLDPRGMDLDGNYSIYGDIRYDVGKLAHSIIGLYDYIIGGFFKCSSSSAYSLELSFPASQTVKEIQESFKKTIIAGHTLQDLSTYPIMVHLFLSMLPLHGDHPERQRAMLANALRLYVEYKKLQ